MEAEIEGVRVVYRDSSYSYLLDQDGSQRFGISLTGFGEALRVNTSHDYERRRIQE